MFVCFFLIIFGVTGGRAAWWPSGLTHPVGVLVVAAVLSEGTFCPLSQEDLGADIAVAGGATAEDGAQRHLTEGGAERRGRLVPQMVPLGSI